MELPLRPFNFRHDALTLLEGLKDRVNKATASITNDYQPQEEVKDPRSMRAICRFLLTLTVGGTLVAVIACLTLNQPNTTLNRVVYKSTEFTHQSENTLLCPCSNVIGISWNTFINFSIVNKSKKVHLRHILNTTQVDYNMMNHSICNTTKSPYSYGCLDIISALFNKKDHRNHIQTIFLLSKDSLIKEAPLQMTSKLLHILELYSIEDHFLEDYKPPILVARSFASMLNQYKWNPNSSEGEFWKASHKLMNKTKYALRMQIDWAKYEQGCNPKYCDVIEHMPMKSKVFRAMADVGGFSSVLLFILRTFLWPSLIWAIDKLQQQNYAL